MKRREAIKSLGLGFGYTITIGSLVSLSACQKDKSDSIRQSVNGFSEDQKRFLDTITEIILPKTETPGASEAKVADFIEMIITNIYEKNDADNFLTGIDAFDKAMFAKMGLSAFKADAGQLEQMYRSLTLELSEKEQEDIKKLTDSDIPQDIVEQNKYHLYKFLPALKNLTITGYFSSELIGEHHLSYDPIPGVYLGCIPVEDVGNVWVL